MIVYLAVEIKYVALTTAVFVIISVRLAQA